MASSVSNNNLRYCLAVQATVRDYNPFIYTCGQRERDTHTHTRKHNHFYTHVRLHIHIPALQTRACARLTQISPCLNSRRDTVEGVENQNQESKRVEARAMLEWVKLMHQDGLIDDTRLKEEQDLIFSSLRL